MPLSPRPEIDNLEVCPHGGPDYAELSAMGTDPDQVLDFSVCTNPFPPPPEIGKMSLDKFAIGRYPDPEATELRELLAAGLDVHPRNIIAGSGTTELIRLITLAYLRPGDRVLLLEPTYGEYEVAARIAGARVIKQRTEEADGFFPRLEETAALVRAHRPRILFLCNPDNPTGRYLSRKNVEAILSTAGDGLLVLDEAYLAFVEAPWSAADLISRDNVVLMRSMTKDYGLAGLRLGYAIAGAGIADCLRRVRPPWNVNAIAQKVGAMMLQRDYLEKTRPQIREAGQFLRDGLSRSGFRIVPSQTHYFLVEVGNSRRFRAALLGRGIQVRDCASFGLPGYVRVSPRTLPGCRKFIDTLDELKRKGEL